MKFVSPAKLSAIGKGFFSLLLTAVALFQIPAVAQAVEPLAKLHPHIAITCGLLTTIGALLSNPQVQNVLGIEKKTINQTPVGTVTTMEKTTVETDADTK